MNILRDPIWQFIGVIVSALSIFVALIALINPIVAAIVFVITLIILIILYPIVRPNKTIFHRVISDTTVLSIKYEEEDKSDIQILYKGEEVKEDIHLIILRLWNASSEPILPEEYKTESIKLDFGKETKILSVQVVESKPLTIKEEIDNNKMIGFKEGKLDLKPIWLNKDNSLTLKVLLTHFQGEVYTDETRIIVGGYVRNWNKSGYSKIEKVINTYFDFFIVPITFISFILIFSLLSYLALIAFHFDISSLKPSENFMGLFIFIPSVILSILFYIILVVFVKKKLLQIFD